LEWGLENGFIDIVESKKSKNGWAVKYKIYLKVDNKGNKISKSVPYKNLITSVLNADAAANMKQIFSSKIFDYAKPVTLIELFLKYVNTEQGVVLDSFSGSGTTAHAVLNLNKQDRGNRKFILIEMEDYAEDVTAERIKRVTKGYGKDKKAVEGTGGSFDFYKLGQPVFKDDSNLNEEIGEEKIRNYIYYTETKQHLEREQTPAHKYLLDTFNDTGYYFYYDKDKLTSLSLDTLNIVTEKAEQYLIYADHCLLDKEYMLAKNIIFKKIPRDIKRF
jgi:adenine-specific DNA-methyltransferase